MRLTQQMTVKIHANPEWVKRALDSVYAVARKTAAFTTDDVWAELERASKDDGLESYADNRALGPIMQRAARLGYCAPTMMMTKTKRKSNHRRPLMLWSSKLANATGLESR